MKTLILTRHAKSSWDDLSLMDHDRILNKRGRKSATAIGRWLVERNHLPQETLCSAAERCRETWARIEQALPSPPAGEFLQRMYLPSSATLYSVLQKASADVVMMLSHNPGRNPTGTKPN